MHNTKGRSPCIFRERGDPMNEKNYPQCKCGSHDCRWDGENIECGLKKGRKYE